MILAIILFALTYVLMLTFSKYRPYIALASGLIFIVSGMLPADQIIGSLDTIINKFTDMPYRYATV